MKSFKALVLIAFIVVIGGVAALYGANYLENGASDYATEEVVVSNNVEENIEPVVEQDQLEPGSYFIFENRSYLSEYDEEANGFDELYEYYRVSIDGEVELITSIEHEKEVSGGLYARTFGQELLVHRYQDENQEALINLNGEIVEVREWIRGNNTLASANGRYEVHAPTVFQEGGDHVQDIIVIDTHQQGEIAHFTRDDFGDDLTWELQPMQIDNNGEYLYIRSTCGGCEGVFTDHWEVNLKTRQIEKISELVEAQDYYLTSLNIDTRQMLAIAQTHEWSAYGPYQELLPPATFQLLDLDTQETQDLFTDEEHAWDQPRMDPTGEYRFVVRKLGNDGEIFLVSMDTDDFVRNAYLANGWLDEWLENVVLLDGYSETPRLVNVDTRVITEVELPNTDDLRYIGAITIE
ncbi:MAG: hypothetical protein P8J32_08610 [bacterium]|jgi:hypothetical protein|nr:hypothetical protein [bacterium]